MSSEKVRVVIFSVFLFALIVFGMAYRPTDASTHSAGNTAVTQPTPQAR